MVAALRASGFLGGGLLAAVFGFHGFRVCSSVGAFVRLLRLSLWKKLPKEPTTRCETGHSAIPNPSTPEA